MRHPIEFYQQHWRQEEKDEFNEVIATINAAVDRMNKYMFDIAYKGGHGDKLMALYHTVNKQMRNAQDTIFDNLDDGRFREFMDRMEALDEDSKA